jgi:hypothetical protein
MDSKTILRNALEHRDSGTFPVDFGATPVTGIHVLLIEKLRKHFGLEKKPLKVPEPYQMLGEVEEDLQEKLGIDVIGISPAKNMFGHVQKGWKTFRTFWGQEVLVPGEFYTTVDKNGDLLMYPEGDPSAAPSAKMPKKSFFFDALIRQKPLNDANLDPEDNLEEFSLFSPEDIEYWRDSAEKASRSGKGVIANFGGTAIGDIALVPAMNLKEPRGIRDIAEWYMSTMMRRDYLHTVFEKQTDIALKNLESAHTAVGERIDAVFICGTDFGTQDSTFCDPETFRELYMPYYRKMNDWIHKNTGWKSFKHSCGAVEPFMPLFIESGFDIINPVQVNAAGMDPVRLKEKYGDRLVFWGGGADTQKILPFASEDEVRDHVRKECEILSKHGGFVFTTVHNIQANVPIENVLAMLEAIAEFRQI